MPKEAAMKTHDSGAMRFDDVARWRRRANEARAAANQLSTPVARSVVLLVAEAYDRLDEQISARIARRARNSTIAETACGR
jgi:hypothetical protein